MPLLAHPLAVVLAWIDLARSDDLNGTKNLLWGLVRSSTCSWLMADSGNASAAKRGQASRINAFREPRRQGSDPARVTHGEQVGLLLDAPPASEGRVQVALPRGGQRPVLGRVQPAQ